MRHPLHSICPYFAMFPKSFVMEQIVAFSRPKEVVFDPFCGRGTTVLESLLNDRKAMGSDINPVAACIAGAKAAVPELKKVYNRLNELKGLLRDCAYRTEPATEFFATCYHRRTYSEIAFLRKNLQWRSDDTDRFIAAVMLGVLHGESSQKCDVFKQSYATYH